MKPLLSSYLRTFRQQKCLTQNELGFLLGVIGDTVSNYERGKRQPPLEVVMATEVIFGISPRRLLPRLYSDIEAEVMGRASRLDERLADGNHKQAREKRTLLREMIERAEPNQRFI